MTSTQKPRAAGPRIIWMVETYHPVLGGGEKYTRSLALGLVAQGLSVDVITRRSSPELPSLETDGGVTVHRVGSPGMGRGRKFSLVWAAGRVARRLAADRDVIMNGGTRVLALAARMAVAGNRCALALRPELNGELDGSLALWGRKSGEATRRFVYVAARARNLLLKRTDAIVAISEEIGREAVRSGFEASRIHHIPHGIDTSHYAPVSALQKLALRKSLGLPEDRILATYTGRLIAGKGLETLFEAFRSLADLPALHLVLVGSGSEQVISIEGKLREEASLAPLAGRITFTGRVENVAAYLQASDVFVFPTLNESLGMSAVEAQACGLPAVASRTGGVPDIIEDGVTGILVPPGDARLFAEALRRLIMDAELRARYATAARKRMEAIFATEVMVARYVDLFKALAASRRAS